MDTGMVMVVAQPAELSVFDPDARVERACELIVDAGQAGAHWIIFPEAYLPGAPTWLWTSQHDDLITHELHALALAAAVVIPGVVSDRLCRVVQRSRVAVVIGVIERDHSSCYNSLLLIDPWGHICRHDRSPLNSTAWSSVSRSITMPIDPAHTHPEWTGGI